LNNPQLIEIRVFGEREIKDDRDRINVAERDYDQLIIDSIISSGCMLTANGKYR